MSRIRYLVRRTLISLGLIMLVATAVFVLFRQMPGSYIDIIAVRSGGSASSEALRALEQKWGVNQPLHVQYIRYLRNLFTGDFGTSFKFGVPVWQLVSRRLFNTFILVAPGIVVGYIIGSMLGALMAWYRGSVGERYGIIIVTILGTLPAFFTGIIMQSIFADALGILPAQGMLSIEATNLFQENKRPFYHILFISDFWLHFILPFLTIVLRYLYFPALIMRTNMVEVSNEDFVYFHRIKGLSQRTQLSHLTKHASLPVITVFPVSMIQAISGMVLIELVFNWPGIGNLLVTSVLARDFPVIQFIVFLTAVWIIMANYVVDIIYGFIDPRVAIGTD